MQVVIGILAALVLKELIELTVAVDPGGIEEPCFPLARGERLEYVFKAAAPLDFNLHFHDDDGVHFPVDLRGMATGEGQYVAPYDRTYCLMWTNKESSPVELEYQYRTYTKENQP